MPSFAYVLLDARRRIGLRHTQFAAATCGTIRRKLLKIGAQVRLSVRRIKIAMASACPYQAEYHLAYLYLQLSKLVDELAGLLGQRTDVLLGPGRAGRAVEPIDRGLDLAQLRGRGVHPATSVADALLKQLAQLPRQAQRWFRRTVWCWRRPRTRSCRRRMIGRSARSTFWMR